MSAEASTQIRLPDPKLAFDHLVGHLADEGLEAESLATDRVRFRRMGCEVNFHYTSDVLKVDIQAPSRSMLFFLKEAAVLHVADIDSLSAEALRWSDSPQVDSQPINFRELTMLRRSSPFPGMLRLTLQGDDLAELASDGIHIKLMLPADRSRSAIWPTVGLNGVTQWPDGENRLHVRYFTIRHFRADLGEVDIDVVQHEGGMISDWARDARAGEVIGVMGPGGGDIPERHKNLLLCGDETALPAIARILEDIGSKATGQVVVAFPENAEIQDYFPETGMPIRTLPPKCFRSEIANAVREIADRHRIRQGWFGGEYANAQELRRIFKKEASLGKGAQLSVAYWREGVRGNAERDEH